MRNSDSWRTWYDSLKKPGWTPAPRTISLIWRVLYPLIFASLIYALWNAFYDLFSWWVALPFILNIFLNLLFTPAFFGLRSLRSATIVILGIWVTILWAMWSIWPYSWFVVLLELPYLVWVSIATVLQLSITIRNPRS